MRTCLCLLCLIGALRAHAAVEFETNDSPATANPMGPDQGTKGQLSSATDQDWFGFSMREAGSIEVGFWFDREITSERHTVQVLDAAGTVFASVDGEGSETRFVTGLPAGGSYFLVVRDGPAANPSTQQYDLSFRLTVPAGLAELEPNDAPATSNPLTLNQRIPGQLASAADQDWFGFNMSAAGSVSVLLLYDRTATPWERHTVQVRDAAGLVYANVDNEGVETWFETGLPAAGSYFVVVRDGPSPSGSTQQYTLSVSTASQPEAKIIQAQINTAVEVAWNTTDGKSYIVEWSATMSDDAWQPLSPSFAGNGGMMYYLDSVRGDAQGFYRVKER